jgi:hypothetical protein
MRGVFEELRGLWKELGFALFWLFCFAFFAFLVMEGFCIFVEYLKCGKYV